MPYSKRSKYYHKRRANPKEFIKGSFKTVPQSHVKSLKKRYPKGTKVIVGKRKKTKRWGVQSILIPKRRR